MGEAGQNHGLLAELVDRGLTRIEVLLAGAHPVLDEVPGLIDGSETALADQLVDAITFLEDLARIEWHSPDRPLTEHGSIRRHPEAQPTRAKRTGRGAPRAYYHAGEWLSTK